MNEEPIEEVVKRLRKYHYARNIAFDHVKLSHVIREGFYVYPLLPLLPTVFSLLIDENNNIKDFAVPIALCTKNSFSRNPFEFDINKPKSPFNTYLMHDYASGYYKIGKARDVSARFNSLSNANPTTTLIAIASNDIENVLHKKYATHKVVGEWFKFPSDVLSDVLSNFETIFNLKTQNEKS